MLGRINEALKNWTLKRKEETFAKTFLIVSVCIDMFSTVAENRSYFLCKDSTEECGPYFRCSRNLDTHSWKARDKGFFPLESWEYENWRFWAIHLKFHKKLCGITVWLWSPKDIFNEWWSQTSLRRLVLKRSFTAPFCIITSWKWRALLLYHSLKYLQFWP